MAKILLVSPSFESVSLISANEKKIEQALKFQPIPTILWVLLSFTLLWKKMDIQSRVFFLTAIVMMIVSNW